MTAPKGTGRRRAARPAAADPAAVLAGASRGDVPPILAVMGRDLFTRDAFVDELRSLMVTEGFEAFNMVSLWGDDVTGARIVSHCEVLPMMAGPEGRRFVLVRRADRLRESDAEPLQDYASAPAASTCLVLVFDQGKAPVLAALKEGVVFVDFPPPRDYQLARWLEGQSRRLGMALDAEAARLLAALHGEDHVGAVSALRRAALEAGGDRPRVTKHLVEAQATRDLDANRFHLADAIFGREPVRALAILRNLDEAGETGYALLGLIEAQLRRFLKMRADVDAGRPARTVVRDASPTLPPSVLERLARQLDGFDQRRLVEAFRLARRTDRAIKGSGSGNVLAHMESLVWRLSSL
ncbi:MAG: DNA polymerase III subunit delta [Candidatus Polarisedimenticolia bacterium]